MMNPLPEDWWGQAMVLVQADVLSESWWAILTMLGGQLYHWVLIVSQWGHHSKQLWYTLWKLWLWKAHVSLVIRPVPCDWWVCGIGPECSVLGWLRHCMLCHMGGGWGWWCWAEPWWVMIESHNGLGWRATNTLDKASVGKAKWILVVWGGV